jgi:ribosome-associated heat shock protein Hsp15
MRIDKWLWAARFFKTRGLAQDAIENGRVLVDDERIKVARTLRVGETVTVRVADVVRTVIVRELSEQRARRRFAAEPALAIEGRPTKRDRRALDRARGGA